MEQFFCGVLVVCVFVLLLRGFLLSVVKRYADTIPEKEETNLFYRFHKRMEKAIQESAVNREIVRWDLIVETLNRNADDLVKYTDPPEGADDCWLKIHYMGIIALCWSFAVAKGKSIDRKREERDRGAWGKRSNRIILDMMLLQRLGKRIGYEQVSREGDLTEEAKEDKALREEDMDLLFRLVMQEEEE